MNWFVEKSGKKYGPYTGEQLKQLANSGKLQTTDLVSKEGMAEPIAASKIKGLFKVAQALPSSPVTSDSVPPASSNRSFAALRSTLHRMCWSTSKRQISTGIGTMMVIGMIGAATDPTFGPNTSRKASTSQRASTPQKATTPQAKTKLRVFEQVVSKYQAQPDRLASSEERRKYNGELKTLQDEFYRCEFNTEQDREQAKAIVALYEKELRWQVFRPVVS